MANFPVWDPAVWTDEVAGIYVALWNKLVGRIDLMNLSTDNQRRLKWHMLVVLRGVLLASLALLPVTLIAAESTIENMSASELVRSKDKIPDCRGLQEPAYNLPGSSIGDCVQFFIRKGGEAEDVHCIGVIFRKIERTKAPRDRRFFVFCNNDQGEARHVISISISIMKYIVGHRSASLVSVRWEVCAVRFQLSASSGPDHICLMFDSLQITPINLGDATRKSEQVWNKAAGNKPINHLVDGQIARSAQRGRIFSN